MSTTAMPPVIPVVSMVAIEQEKENIQPTSSGRSASHLVALSTQSRSTLLTTLAAAHTRFLAQLAAVAHYDQHSEWEEGRDGLSSEEVATIAEDPLDPHHQYVRYINANYPAGPSAQNRLIPLLEASTRAFVKDERYRNDPRYLRLWNLYAKMVEGEEDVYRYLWARGVGERLALFYEEYAYVLEAAGKREEAAAMYMAGIQRKAAPLDRLKKRYQAFQARMLIAPPLPTPAASPALALGSSRTGTRTALTGLSTSTTALGNTTSNPNNAKSFAVFQDSEPASGGLTSEEVEGSKWEEIGTLKSRKKENERDATGWKGEVLAMPVKLGRSEKLEVFVDEDLIDDSAPAAKGPAVESIVQLRGPVPALDIEHLRRNPFANYTEADLSVESDRPPTPVPTVVPVLAPKSTSSKTKRSKTVVSSTPGVPVPSRTTCPLDLIYPSGASSINGEPVEEYSFEELKIRRAAGDKYRAEVQTWSGWADAQRWDVEVRRTGVTSWRTGSDGRPLLTDPVTGAPLWEFVAADLEVVRKADELAAQLRRQQQEDAAKVERDEQDRIRRVEEERVEQVEREEREYNEKVERETRERDAREQEVREKEELAAREAQEAAEREEALRTPPTPTPTKASILDQLVPLTVYESPSSSQSQTLSPSSPRIAHVAASPSPSPAPFHQSDSAAQLYVDPRRPPSPTMNTRMAQAIVDSQWNKTLVFGANDNDSSDQDSSDQDPDTESDDDDVLHSVSNVGESQSQNQWTQDTGDEREDEDNSPFVPFSQQGESQSQASFVMEEGVEGDVEEDEPLETEPVRLFVEERVSFKPRAPLGVKSFGGVPSSTPISRAFEVLVDDAEEEEDVIPSSHPEYVNEDLEEFEAALRLDDEAIAHSMNERDGFAMGRRPIGTNRWAPLIDNMTPISERTYEFTSASAGRTMGERRESVYSGAGTASVLEEEEEEEDEDEEEDSEDEEGDGDRAFVAYEQEDEEEDSDGSRDSSTSEDEEDDEEVVAVGQLLAPLSLANDSATDQDSSWQESTRKDGHFDEDDSIAEIEHSIEVEAPTNRSFDVSVNTSLPEGYTITGNQSGMNTGMVLGDTTNIVVPASAFPNPCHPYHPSTLAKLFARLESPIVDHPDVRDLMDVDANKLAGLQKTAKKREGTSRRKSKDRTGVIDEVWELELDGEVFSVREKLGEGSFGAVFRIVTPFVERDEDEDDDEEDEETSVAVKVERPTNLWEFSILSQLHTRLASHLRPSVIDAKRLYAFQDESYLFLDFADQGTLLDAVNKANEAGVSPATGGASLGLEEIVAMFFVIELLRLVDGFHSAGFIHGDLKIDNCLVRFEDVPGGARAWSTTYDPSGGGGWSSKGVKVIDFGRSIDLSAFPTGQTFATDFKTDALDCYEMREGKSWSFEPDYYGVASIAFNLIFGKYIETKTIVDEAGIGRQTINQNFRRYHQVDLWTKLFDALLNPKLVGDGTLPISNELGAIRMEMESWLVKNSDRNGKSLRGLIKKMEIFAMAQ